MIGPEHINALIKFDLLNKKSKDLSEEEARKQFYQNIKIGAFLIIFTISAFYVINLLSFLWFLIGLLGIYFIANAGILQLKFLLFPKKIGFIFIISAGSLFLFPTNNNTMQYFFIHLIFIPTFLILGTLIFLKDKVKEQALND